MYQIFHHKTQTVKCEKIIDTLKRISQLFFLQVFCQKEEIYTLQDLLFFIHLIWLYL